MSGKRKKTSVSSKPKNLSQEILKKFQNNPTQAYNYKQVSRLLKINQSSIRKLINSKLMELAAKEKLVEVSRGKYKLNYVPNTVEGKVDMTSSGNAFIIVADREEDIFISHKEVKNAMHGDMVQVSLFPTSAGKRAEGKITKVIERKKQSLVGIIEISRKYAFVIPDQTKIHVDIYVPIENLKGASDGEKVIVKILEWPKNAQNPIGEVTEVLGKPGEHQVEMHSILAEYGLPVSFPSSVEKEAQEINTEITKKDIKSRRDFRDITTFTIDPHDAKDFDDALSFKKIDEGKYEVGIHIADVSHYVQPKSILDKEAYHRATSVYLVDRVIPMLPEVLSNQVCSLRPNEEKLCFSAVFEIDENADILSQWFGRTVILSNRRFTYEEAQMVIDTGEGDLSEEILTLDKLAKKFRKNRSKNGAINFNKVEVRFELDDKGNPLGVILKESKDANKLIEEFMLLANKKVAEFIGKNSVKKASKKTFVYRIHDKPDQEKMNNFVGFISQFGYKMNTKSTNEISKSFNKLLDKVDGKAEQNVIEQLAIRTMSKAIYTTSNIGHYGLAFDHYTHFTSPIRRYPDVMVHRLLQHYLDGGSSVDAKSVEAQCKHSSDMEKVATEAERASIKYKQVEYLKDKIGEEFEGLISGVSEWGIYVELMGNKCEGMVRLKEIKDDYYYFDEKNYQIVGRRHRNTYRLGDSVTVVIKKADLLKKQLDFELVE